MGFVIKFTRKRREHASINILYIMKEKEDLNEKKKETKQNKTNESKFLE